MKSRGTSVLGLEGLQSGHEGNHFGRQIALSGIEHARCGRHNQQSLLQLLLRRDLALLKALYLRPQLLNLLIKLQHLCSLSTLHLFPRGLHVLEALLQERLRLRLC